MSTEQTSFGRRATRAIVRLIAFAGALVLLGAVGVLLAELNARSFWLELQGDKLVVMKGRHLPMGMEPYRPQDPALADTYAPITLEGPPPAIPQGRLRDRDELDRVLFDLLADQARPRVVSDDPAVLQKGLTALRRAERLSGLSTEQKESLKRMLIDVSYYQARLKLDDARRMVSEAVSLLRVASESENRRARAASQMLSTIEPAVENFDQALRTAVHEISRPAADERPAEPPSPPPPPKVETPVEPAADAGT